MTMMIKSALLVFATLLVVMTIHPSQSEARSLGYRTKLVCVGQLHRICNYIGSYCHAEVLSGRKRRSLSTSSDGGEQMSRFVSQNGKRHRITVKLRIKSKCRICDQFCW